MTDKYESTAALKQAMRETQYNPFQMGRYLGVPAPTLRGWLAERRQMPVIAERLLTILNLVRVLAPELHEHFLPPAPKMDRRRRENWSAERIARGRKPRTRAGVL